MNDIHGYTLGTAAVSRSPVTLADFEAMKASALFGEEDVRYLRMSHDVVKDQVEAILDVWYGFVGNHDFLLAYFSTPDGPDADYLARVRARFGQWILDTCRAEYDESWLAYQEEIARRHYQDKNKTDGVEGAPPFIHFRYVNALIYPIFATIRPFLEKGESDPAEVERMHQAWLKAVLLQVTLWSQPYLREGAF